MSEGRKRTGFAVVVALVGVCVIWLNRPVHHAPWTDAEIETIRSLWIGSLPDMPASPSNRVADDPRAARFGRHLFFDPRLSGNGAIACATCHEPARRFTDGRRKGVAIGVSQRNTPSIAGAAFSPWLYWDGRKDSLWSQALSPLEDPAEHGGTRMQYARLIATDPRYTTVYEALFGPLPELTDRDRFPPAAAPVDDARLNAAWQAMDAVDRHRVNQVFVNIGKSIAAYERLLLPGPSRFDSYAEAVLNHDEALQERTFTEQEALGLRVFISKARCTECHNGPLFTNNEFHNTGVLSFPGDLPDRGRIVGVRKSKADPFNCLGEYADSGSDDCAELRFARTGPELIGAMRTPSLRNIDGTGPYMHKGQLHELVEVLDHYNRAPAAMIGHNQAEPLGLSARELRHLEAFLETLAAPLATPPEWLSAPSSTPGDRTLAAGSRR